MGRPGWSGTPVVGVGEGREGPGPGLRYRAAPGHPSHGDRPPRRRRRPGNRLQMDRQRSASGRHPGLLRERRCCPGRPVQVPLRRRLIAVSVTASRRRTHSPSRTSGKRCRPFEIGRQSRTPFVFRKTRMGHRETPEDAENSGVVTDAGSHCTPPLSASRSCSYGECELTCTAVAKGGPRPMAQLVSNRCHTGWSGSKRRGTSPRWDRAAALPTECRGNPGQLHPRS